MDFPRVDGRTLDEWCSRHLGSRIAAERFRSGRLGAVTGVLLADGREVVVKVREPAARLEGCFAVQSLLHTAGFPAPEPVLPPTPFGRWTATVESLVGGGGELPSSGHDPRPYAVALEAMVRIAAPMAPRVDLEPKPSWNRWDHDGPGVWSTAEDVDRPFHSVTGPDWLERAGKGAHERIAGWQAPKVVGHGDWHRNNFRWRGEELHVAYDWDSAIVDTEAVVVGIAAAWVAPSVEESAAFLSAYQDVAGRRFGRDELEVSWATGLWLRGWKSKRQVVTGEPIRSLSEDEAVRLSALAGL
ncbi:phosphotransferase [Kitasatospora sp. NPDC056181]|uniref:phosphotransferase n=1 Tax=Kitasatospora sp. NPDC056181 TaxID=3345737 RepID=UPI0035DEB125